MDVLYVGSEVGPMVCDPRRVIMKNLKISYGEKITKFRLWCVHRHTVRLLSGMYPSRRVLCTPAYMGGGFPQAIRVKTMSDLWVQLLRFSAPSTAWSPPLRI